MFSLQSLCLDVIVFNFQKFHFAITASTDARLLRNLYFLQRRYSNHLAEKLLTAVFKDGNNAYLDFLMNEHLTSFKIPIYCFFPTLEDDMNEEEIPSNESFGDEFLEKISKCCPRMVKIDASSTNFTDKGIQFLCETKNGMLPCPELKEIKMTSEDSITDKGAECLIRSLPLLERFSYPYLPRVLHSVHTRNSTEFEKAHTFNLTKLDLGPCEDMSNLAEIIKSCLTVCPKLESVTCYLLEKKQLDELANCQLKKLFLVLSQKISDINIDYFFKMSGRNLIDLQLYQCTVSASALAIHCPILEKLDMFDVNFTDGDDVQPFFPSLTSCGFLEISSIIIKAFHLLFSSSPKLESIAFANGILCSEMKKQILMWCKSPAAKDICFSGVELEIKFLRDILLNCCSLKRMRLVDCSYNVRNPFKKLSLLAEKLSNKPIIEYLL